MASGAFIELNARSRAQLVALETGDLPITPCGICETPGVDVCWPNPLSEGAHRTCFQVVSKTQTQLMTTIRDLFKEIIDRSHAHIRAVEAVQKHIRPATFKSYVQTNGEKALTDLFNTIGIQAVKQFADEKQNGPRL